MQSTGEAMTEVSTGRIVTFLVCNICITMKHIRRFSDKDDKVNCLYTEKDEA